MRTGRSGGSKRAARRLRRLLKHHPNLDLTWRDGQGRTLLHQACACGNTAAVKVLLRRGALPGALDAAGDAPAHVAARAGHLDTVAELLQKSRPPTPLDAPDGAGVSLAELLRRALGGEAGNGAAAAGAPAEEAAEEEDEEAAWRRRLQEEHSGGEGGHAFGGGAGGGEESWFGWGEVGGVSDDVWADRLWSQMQRRRRAAAAASSAAIAAELRAAQAEKRAAEARERSAQILQEEQAKDAQWRRRAIMGPSLPDAAPVPLDLSACKAAYDARWAALDGQPPTASAPLRYWDIPWPLEGPLPPGAAAGAPAPAAPPPPPSADALRDFLLLGAAGPADVKRALRSELLRWHPDKFGARFSARLRAGGSGEQEAAAARVAQLAQVLTQLLK